MSRDLTRRMQRGLLVPDPRVRLARDDADHTWLDAGPRPGVAEDQGERRSMLVLTTAGAQARDARLRIRCVRAGFPGDRRRAGAYVYRDEADDAWRGWDPPSAVTGWEWINRVASPSTAVMRQAHMLRLDDGRVLLAARYVGASGPVVTVRRYDPTTGAWTTLASVGPTTTVFGGAAEAISSQAWPCLVQIPGGRVHLYAWVEGSDYEQLSLWYSDDAGETWTRGSRWCLAQELPAGTIGGKVRLALNAGQMLMVAQLSTGELRQWASDDYGTRWHVVGDDRGTDIRSPEVLPLEGGAWRVAWVDGAADVCVVRAASAWEPFGVNVSALPGRPYDGEAGGLGTWRDEDGVWYAAVWRDPLAAGGTRVIVARSYDQGATWTSLRAVWPTGGVSGQLAHELAGAATCGQHMLAARFTDETSDLGDASMLMLYLGGHSTVTMPATTRSRLDVDQAGWSMLWVPIDPPDAWTGWSVVGSGVHNAQLQEAGLVVSVGASGSRTYTYTGLATGPSHEAHAVAELRIGSASAGSYSSIAAWGGSSAGSYGAEVRLEGDVLSLYDAGGSTLGTTVVDGQASMWQIWLHVGAGRARCWYRPVPTPGEPEREWIAGPAGTAQLIAGPAAPAGQVQLRVVGGTGGVASSTWRMVAAVAVEPAIAVATDAPEDLFPRAFSSLPVRLPGGVILEARDGPAMDGETWHVDTRYEYSADLLDPIRYPSPRRVSRSEGAGSRSLVYDLSAVAGAATRLDTSTWGVAIYGASTCDVQLAGWDGAQWVPLTSGSSWVEGLLYERLGEAVHPDPAEPDPAADPLYIERDMLAGAVIDLGGTVRRIRTNTEGWWGSGTGRRPVLYLDPEHLDGTEPSSGTCRIGPGERGQVILVHGLDRYSRLRVTLGEGWGPLEAGVVVVGAMLLFGQEYSWGRSRSLTPQTALSTMRGGTRHSRVEAPPRRAVELRWSEGVIDRQMWRDQAPDYRRAWTGGDPVASTADVGSMLEGLVRQLGGPHVPIVYLPAVPSDAQEVRLRWPSQHLYGRLVGGVRREAYLGDELEGEVERVASILIEEEL